MTATGASSRGAARPVLPSTATAGTLEAARYLADLHAASSGLMHRVVPHAPEPHVCTLGETRTLIRSGGEAVH